MRDRVHGKSVSLDGEIIFMPLDPADTAKFSVFAGAHQRDDSDAIVTEFDVVTVGETTVVIRTKGVAA